MAIQTKDITLDGLTYTLDDRDRVAAELAQENANTFTSNNIFSAGAQVTHAVPTPAATITLTLAANGNRTNVIESIATTGGDNYVLPTAGSVGEWYRFVWGGNAADADDIIFVASAADGLTFEGGVLSLDNDADAGTLSDAIKSKYPGADDDKLTLVNPDGFDITFTAVTTTKYVVSGWATSTDSHAAFGDI